MTFTRALSTNNYGPAKFIVDSSAANGTHTTIATALTSASSGDTIFIRPGTYTENLTLKAGVNLTAFNSDSSLNGTGKVIISGTCTLTTAGSVTIAGIQLQTNSAAILAVTGSVASIVNLNNCFLNCTNNSGITYSSSSASSAINIFFCEGDLGTTGIAYFSHSSAGNLTLRDCTFANSGGSSTVNTVSAGGVVISRSEIFNPTTTSGTGGASIIFSNISGSAQNATAFTVGGSGAHLFLYTYFQSGTASAISISATLTCHAITVQSTNTNAITGAGTINYSAISFNGTSTTINTTTQTITGTLQGSKNTAPSAGFLGEQLTANAVGTSVSNNTPVSIANISLTAGVWDVSAVGVFAFTGVNTAQILVISSTINDVTTGVTSGINRVSRTLGVTTTGNTLCIPQYRIALSATTTYYVNTNQLFSTGTATVDARITATRVG